MNMKDFKNKFEQKFINNEFPNSNYVDEWKIYFIRLGNLFIELKWIQSTVYRLTLKQKHKGYVMQCLDINRIGLEEVFDCLDADCFETMAAKLLEKKD